MEQIVRRAQIFGKLSYSSTVVTDHTVVDVDRNLRDVALVDIPKRGVNEHGFLSIVADFTVDQFDGFVCLSEIKLTVLSQKTIVISSCDAAEIPLNLGRRYLKSWHRSPNYSVIDVLYWGLDGAQD